MNIFRFILLACLVSLTLNTYGQGITNANTINYYVKLNALKSNVNNDGDAEEPAWRWKFRKNSPYTGSCLSSNYSGNDAYCYSTTVEHGTWVYPNKVVLSGETSLGQPVTDELSFTTFSWENDCESNCSYNSCFGDVDNFGHCWSNSLRISNFSGINDWGYYTWDKSGEWSSFQFAGVYRYSNGNTLSEPLTFGSFGHGSQAVHYNSNKSAPEGLAADYGYTHTTGDSSPDVVYSFVVEGSKRVVISTDYEETNFDTKIRLLKSNNELIEMDDDDGSGRTSKIERVLCAGTYKLVVEGYSSNVGNFKVSIFTENAHTITPGNISSPGSVCKEAAIPEIISTQAGTVNCGTPTYEWRLWDYDTEQYQLVEGANAATYTPPFLMGDKCLFYYRQTKDEYGNIGYPGTDIISICPSSTTVDAGRIEYNGPTTVASGHDPGSITSFRDASATPGMTILWEKRERNGTSWTTWGAADGVNNGQNYDIPPLLKTTEFRRKTQSSCYSPQYPAEAHSRDYRINVVEANGVIRGTITSSLGTGVPGITVTASRISNVSGGTTQNGTGTAVTNGSGDYTISNLYYGSGTAGFTVTPSLAGHEFDPVDRIVYLNSSQPKTANFTDVSTFTITGNISQSYGSTSCNLEGVKMDLIFNGTVINPNEETSITDESGNYTINVEHQGTYTLRPSYHDHVFSPAPEPFFVNNHITGKDFSDITTVSLQGYVRAGCETFMGTSEVTLTDDESCFTITGTTNQDGFYLIHDIPARVYNGKVTDFTPVAGFNKPTVLGFFNKTKIIDLSQESVNQDFTYHRPPMIEVIGLPEAPCSAVDYPVLEQGKSTTLTVKVWEEGGTCPVGIGTLSINNQIGDMGNDPIVLEFTDGVYEYELEAGNPNIIYPYLKTLTIAAIDTFERAVNFNMEALVTGGRPRETNYSTQSPELPFLILHDPPGDLSYSFFEENNVTETATRFYAAKGNVSNRWGNVRIGTKFEASVFGIGTETAFWGDVKGAYQINSTNSNANETIISVSNTSRFETSDQELITGDKGDVFVGAALAFAYAISDEVLFDEENCQVLLDKELIIATEGLVAEYIFTEHHIRESVIPELEMLRDAPGLSSAQRANYNSQIMVWEQTLQRNEELKANAVDNGDPAFTFIGGGTGNFYEETNTTSDITTIEFAMEIDEEIATEMGFEIGGSGIRGGLITNFKMETGNSKTTAEINSVTTGYFLKDSDPLDEFTINVKTDPVYKTPVFEVLGGQSSCPAEEGTNAREAVQLSADNPIQAGIPADGTATFTLQAGNISEIEETRDYLIRFNQVTNPAGAAITLGGSPYTGPVLLNNIAFGAEAEVTVTVTRGINSPVYTYEGLEFELYSECDPNISSTVQLTAFFQSPCSDITLVEPLDGFVLTQSDHNEMILRLTDYDVNNIDQVTLFYTPSGIMDWKPGLVLSSDDLEDSSFGTEVIWEVQNLADGNYDLRLELACGLNTVYSARISGTLDRTAPAILGRPEPTDHVYSVGDEISIAFTEALRCSNISAANVEMRRVFQNEIIHAQVTCFENELVITPNIPIHGFTAEPIQVILTGVQDVYGNEKTAPIVWDFNIEGDQAGLDFDNDGVPDPLDKCNGFDDNIDSDGDGIPDACDLCEEEANRGLDFDGVNDYLSMGSELGNFGMEDFTIEFWVKTNTTPVNNIMLLLSKRDHCNCANLWDLYVRDDGTLTWQGIQSAAECAPELRTILRGNRPITDGEWHHIAAVRNSTTFSFYIDGILDASVEITNRIDLNNSSQFRVSKTGCTSSPWFQKYFRGKMDELRVWSTARSTAELSAGLEQEIAPNSPNLIAYYDFNEGVPNQSNVSVSSITDLSASGYNGTLHHFSKLGTSSNWSIGSPIHPRDENNNGIGDFCELDLLSTSTNVSEEEEMMANTLEEEVVKDTEQEEVSEERFNEEITKVFEFTRMYPNPAQSQVNIDFVLSQREEIHLLITDMTGRTVSTQKVMGKAGRNQIRTQVKDLLAGIYVVRLAKANGDFEVRKLVVQ